MIRTLGAALACAAVMTGAAMAQTAPAPGAGRGQAPLAIPNPHYETIVMEVTVNRPAAQVWARVGKYCDIGEWLRVNCTILSGQGEVGTVRSVANEILVGKTELSYTYTQPVRQGQPYNLYHGTVEARPLTAATSKLIYTLLYDNSMLADDAARAMDRENRRMRFQQALENMKILAEGGTLPPAPARQGGAGRGN
jgi:hypothetical protein